jgi:hypothetical protein
VRRSRSPYEPIAEIVGTSEQNARQLTARARRHVEERRPQFEASRELQEQLASRFFVAADAGDLRGLEQLLAHDVVLRGDGGGKAPALRHAIHGRNKVAHAGRGTAGRRALRRIHLAPGGHERPAGVQSSSTGRAGLPG